MNYLNELNAYDKFCKTYFEKSESISFLKEKTKIIRVFQMLELFNIIYDYFYNSKTVVCELALICKGIVLQLLYSIPVGDEVFTSACSRQLSEKLLDLVYVTIVDDATTTKKITKIRYRSLWQDGIKSDGAKYDELSRFKGKNDIQDLKEVLDQINNIFKSESDVLHLKKKELSINYLEQIIKNGAEFNKKKLRSNINIFSRFIIDYLPRLLDMKYEDMTMAQKKDYICLVKFLKPKAYKMHA